MRRHSIPKPRSLQDTKMKLGRLVHAVRHEKVGSLSICLSRPSAHISQYVLLSIHLSVWICPSILVSVCQYIYSQKRKLLHPKRCATTIVSCTSKVDIVGVGLRTEEVHSWLIMESSGSDTYCNWLCPLALRMRLMPLHSSWLRYASIFAVLPVLSSYLSRPPL